MANSILRDEILKAINADPILFGKVASHFKTTARYGLEMINKNNRKLRDIDVLKIIAEHLNIKDIEDLLEPELEAKDNTQTS